MFRRSEVTPGAGLDWTIALAGGDGVRLAEYVESRFGERRPKQYCKLLGQRSMLEHTLDRLNDLTPATRTLTVIGPDHEKWARQQLVGRSAHVFRQPSSRETGTALYVALAMLKSWAPDAIVTITPTDHYVTPAPRYLANIARAREIARVNADKVVLVGAQPNEVDPELGYVSVGTEVRPGLHAVAAFVEKPETSVAEQLIRQGALWNTMVCCGSVSAFWELGRVGAPALIELLENLVPLIGTDDEDAAIEEVYRVAPVIGFSRDILEKSPDHLLTVALAGVEWNDWGRADRIESTLQKRRARAILAATPARLATAS